MKQRCSIWLGFDPREAAAYAVARSSIRRRLTLPIPIKGLVLDALKADGLFWRPQEQRGGQLWDLISDAPCSTQFSISRFLVPYLAGQLVGKENDPDRQAGWALFADCDILARANLARLFDLADPSKAVMVVKHDHQPANAVKMDGQVQTTYARKNWSSVILWNADHPSNARLTPGLVNSVPGRDLHQFCWLEDHEIGELPVEWNWLAGHSDPSVNPAIVHHTDGSPCMAGFEDAPFANEWRAELERWAL